MLHEPRAAYDTLAKLKREFDCYFDGGFFDAVAVGSGQIAQRYLSLDQAMIMGVLGTVLAGDLVRRAFSRGVVERTIRPLIGQERFGAGT